VANTAGRSRIRVTPDAAWPSRLTLRRGLSLAAARPWNANYPDASLRLSRGGRGFLRACVAVLGELGAPTCFSPPLPTHAQEVWKDAGFSAFLHLKLLRCDLTAGAERPGADVLTSSDLDGAVAVDAAAFDAFWVMDRAGLEESLASTKRSEMLAVGDPMAGFAIVGYGPVSSYVQRVAVHPQHQGRGLGTELLRTAAWRARRRGSRAMLLNTQVDNDRSLRLYARLGYEDLAAGLTLLRT
jgi:ribosomal protein S18 acetylase RimI-like enzyme